MTNNGTAYILSVSRIKEMLGIFLDTRTLTEAFLVWLICDTIERRFGIEIHRWTTRDSSTYRNIKNRMDSIVLIDDIVYGCISDYFFGYYTRSIACSKVADDFIMFHEIRGIQNDQQYINTKQVFTINKPAATATGRLQVRSAEVC